MLDINQDRMNEVAQQAFDETNSLRRQIAEWEKSRQKIREAERAGKGDAPSDVTTFTLIQSL